jgi:hypothetical protein
MVNTCIYFSPRPLMDLMGGDEFESEISLLPKTKSLCIISRVLNFINEVVESDSNWFVILFTYTTEYRLIFYDKHNINVLFRCILFNIRSSEI